MTKHEQKRIKRGSRQRNRHLAVYHKQRDRFDKQIPRYVDTGHICEEYKHDTAIQFITLKGCILQPEIMGIFHLYLN